MSEYLENVSEEAFGPDAEESQSGRPGADPAEQPDLGIPLGAGEGPDRTGGQSDQDEPERDEPEQGLGQPDSH